ncbi:hypothetical protein H632_c376p0, partial [Helicosporidium sp. ATCC 50920]
MMLGRLRPARTWRVVESQAAQVADWWRGGSDPSRPRPSFLSTSQWPFGAPQERRGKHTAGPSSGDFVDPLVQGAIESSSDASLEHQSAVLRALCDPPPEQLSGIVGSVAEGIEWLHQTSGLPWWATFPLLAAGVRLALFPLAVQAARAQGSASLVGVARTQLMEEAAGARSGAGERRRDRPPPLLKKPGLRAVLARAQALRRRLELPHPAWALASPLAQLPVFVGVLAGVRGMARVDWPGLSHGGTAWFLDLTAPALDSAAWIAPQGALGFILPAAATLAMLANMEAALRLPALSAEEAARLPSSQALRRAALRYVRLALELALVPVLVVALHMPAAGALYWAASSGVALVQGE